MKRYLLCAGFDYEFTAAPFALFCARRQKQLAASARRGEDLTFTTFDVRSGTKNTLEIRWSNGRSAQRTRSEKLFTPVTRTSFTKGTATDPASGRQVTYYTFNDNQPTVMSIVDLYKEIVALGTADPGSIVEVSIFSHAFHEGPILVNSDDDGVIQRQSQQQGDQREVVPVPKGGRDPDDKDGRALKDFVPPTLSPRNAPLFTRAFDPSGYVWIWGCNYPPPLNTVLRQVENHPKYAQNIGDDQQLEFKALKKHELDSFLVFNNFLHLDPDEVRRTRKVSVSFGRIKDAVWAGVAGSYPFQLALHTKVRAMGALYGTFAELNALNPQLMAISTNTVRHVNFHKKHFNARVDPEGRNYGIYDSAFINQR